MWVALMLTYLLGDVLRIFSGDFVPGEIGGIKATPAIWLAAAVIMLVPVAMVVLSATLGGSPLRWATMGAAVSCSASTSSGCRDTQAPTTGS
jgi:hypothetical protein